PATVAPAASKRSPATTEARSPAIRSAAPRPFFMVARGYRPNRSRSTVRGRCAAMWCSALRRGLADHLEGGVAQRLAGGAERLHLGVDVLAAGGQRAQQDVLEPDVAVAERQRLAQGLLQRLLGARAEAEALRAGARGGCVRRGRPSDARGAQDGGGA